MEIVGVENFDTDENYIEVLFDGLFHEGFYVRTEFDFEVEIVQHEELSVGCQEIKAATNITFFDFKTFNSEEEEISINNRELNKIKQLVEFELIDLLDDEINNN